MDRFARVVLGYHGCTRSFADSILSGRTKIEKWRASKNGWDWLGHGIYFWEHSPERARKWARDYKKRGKRGVVGAVIQLGNCLDFTDISYTAVLEAHYESMAETYKETDRQLPSNRGKNRALDCLVINDLVKQSESVPKAFQTVRCPFLEGEPAFPGSEILKESHIQISVIDRRSILGVFRPNFDLRRV